MKLSSLVLLLTIVGVLYINVWWGLIEPILTVASAIDNKTATASLIGLEVIKFFLKEFLGAIVGYSGFVWYMSLMLKGK